ncbi:MAG: oligopeptide transporter, OPT family [Candidatus Sericytochromatia bacterium]|nr:oligopeptide transporter, OPT family [Candidatus Sericytochromatia bacterium]
MAVQQPTREEPATAFRPYIPDHASLREFGILPLLVGTLLGAVFGASSLYLVLKVGLTVSASIPVAVLSIALFRLLGKFGVRPATILENNLVQTAGSAGESIAFGVGVTMPAILILGFDLELTRVMLVATLGGLLGIMLMIPLRRALIVKQHGVLAYPEGTACAEVLKAAASPESRAAASGAEGATTTSVTDPASARAIFGGFGLGFVYQILMLGLKGWKEVPERVFGAPLAGGSVGAEVSPALLGVGYIIGPRVAAVMTAGGVLAYLVFIPAIRYFGGSGIIPPGLVPIDSMAPGQIRGTYLLYIGAGAVATGGIISLFRSLPLIGHSILAGLDDLRGSREAGSEAVRPRTDRDLPLGLVLGGILLLIAGILAAPSLHMNLLGALMILLFGALFATVSSRITGEIGSSSNPISGMTVATLLLTCLVFLGLGWTSHNDYVTALSVGAIVCIAASNAGTTSQDLKTGHLVGATPRLQQIAILFGAFASALALGPVLLGLNQAATVYVPQKVVLTEGASTSVRVAFPEGFRAPVGELGNEERLEGPQAVDDRATYRVWQQQDPDRGPVGKYLCREDGTVTWLVDPGINGSWDRRPDGTTVAKYDAPKATLMSYIIKGILNRELPWTLVILGGFVSIVLELAGIPSLAFAVGLYLPLAASVPIMVGGAIRWWVDRRKPALEGDADEGSPGVLLASGYIAGGALAGIVIAFLAGVTQAFSASVEEWSTEHNPFFAGPWSDALSLLPFGLLALLLLNVASRRPNSPRA